MSGLRPERMRYVTIYLLQDDVQHIALQLARFGWFDPSTPAKEDLRLPTCPDESYRELYTRARKRYDKVTHFLGAPPPDDKAMPAKMVSNDSLAEIDQRLGNLWQQCSELEGAQRKVAEDIHHFQQLYSTLQRYKKLNINLDRLQRPHAFLDVRLGTIPLSETAKLRDALSLNQYTLIVFGQQENLAHVVIAGDKNQSENVEKVLNAASFRITQLPDEFHDYPERLQEQLDTQIAALSRQQESWEKEINEVAANNRHFLQKARRYLNVAAAYAELSEKLEREGALSAVEGWVPRKQIDDLKTILLKELKGDYVLHVRAPKVEERSQVPSYSDHSGFLRPFAKLVDNYGVPRYGELDPTLLFALSYILMFGMMFGDIGQGAVIFLAGLFLRKKIPDYWIFVCAIGISSSLFGFVYGSLFGFEEIIHPLWMSPLGDPIHMLTVALGWGIGFIVLMIILSAHNFWIEGDVHNAAFSGRGIAGLLFYISLIIMLWYWYENGRLLIPAAGLAVIALGFVSVHSWRSLSSAHGERLLVVIIETFEMLMSYFSNTLSFLRVAAFSLNHVALLVAVFAVSNMFDKTGEWITIILGNIFVLILEGAIVAIQVLRLEYYEGFSRFYRGDGVAFRPLTTGDAS